MITNSVNVALENIEDLPESNCWFSFALAFQLFRSVESSSLFHLCNLLIFCVLGDVALMS